MRRLFNFFSLQVKLISIEDHLNLLYNICKYNLVDNLENYYVYISFVLKLKENDIYNLNILRAGFTLGFLCLNKRQVDPLFLDYLNSIPEYIRNNVKNLTRDDVEDALLTLCMTDLLIRYGLVKNKFNEIFTSELIEALNTHILENRIKSAKHVKFEKLLKENSIQFETDMLTNVYHIDYIITINKQVI